MKQLIIDRYEGKYAVCEDKEMKYFAIELSELPEGAKIGAVIEIDDGGEITVNEAETANRKNRISAKQDKAFRR
jgi:Protein of unknown function (DUF3006).